MELKYSDIRKHLHVEKLNGTAEDVASLTHYLQNSFHKEAETYYQRASDFYNELQLKVPELEQISLQQLLPLRWDVPFPRPNDYRFTFIDLFAGIGGFRLAFQNLGGKCVFTSEWDEQAKRTYDANFGEVPFGDITKESTKSFIPHQFDVLCAGFPCQAFSIAGKRGGFEDTRGTLFFDVAEIIRRHRPRAFFLENVKGLRNHDKGKTLATILNVLRNELGYYVPEPQIINAKNFGVPQNRERIFIVGFSQG